MVPAAGAGNVWTVGEPPVVELVVVLVVSGPAAGSVTGVAAAGGVSAGIVVVVWAAAVLAANNAASAIGRLIRELFIGDRDLHPLGRRRDGVECQKHRPADTGEQDQQDQRKQQSFHILGAVPVDYARRPARAAATRDGPRACDIDDDLC